MRPPRGSAAAGFLGTALLAGCAGGAGFAPWPGPDRAGLRVPDALWERVRTETGYAGREVGFSEADFATLFKPGVQDRGFRHVAPGLLDLFKDARAAPAMSGTLSDRLVSAGTLAGRLAAANALFGRPGAPDVPSAPTAEAVGILSGQPGWDRLPAGFRDLAARILSVSLAAAPVLRAAAGEAFVREALSSPDPREIAAAALYDLASAPHHFERDPRTIRPESLDLLDVADHAALAREGARIVAGVESAVADLKAWLAANPPGEKDFAETVSFTTPLGTLRIGSVKDDRHEGGDFLVVDPGGNDHYGGRTAASAGFAMPVSIAIDLAGNDHYDSGSAPAGLACGLFGAGVLMDLAGNDYYRTAGAGLGCGLFGTGVLLDAAGDDFYLTLDLWGEGAGVAGVGILADLTGDDAYRARYLSQGFAGCLGVGLLLDTAGNDRYHATGWDGPSNPFKANRPLSLSQGFSIGRRPDGSTKKEKEKEEAARKAAAKDGKDPPAEPPPDVKTLPPSRRGLAGGYGVLVDAGGDDLYEGHVYSGGSGYWFGMGIFEDLAGDDTYARASYSAGSAPHYAIGVCVDRAGNDAYNAATDDSRTSFGHGRDIGIGVFVDGDGDDRYRLGPMCGGSVSIQAVGLFWDRRGNDLYEVVAKADHAGDYPYALGNASVSQTEERGSTDSKKGLIGAGIFLDTGGRDTYRSVPPFDPLASGIRPAEGRVQQGRDGCEWRDTMKGVLTGYGRDLDWYPAAPPRAHDASKQPDGKKGKKKGGE